MQMKCVGGLDGTCPAKLRAVHLIKELSPAMGLHVNMANCELFSMKDNTVLSSAHAIWTVLSSKYCM